MGGGGKSVLRIRPETYASYIVQPSTFISTSLAFLFFLLLIYLRGPQEIVGFFEPVFHANSPFSGNI